MTWLLIRCAINIAAVFYSAGLAICRGMNLHRKQPGRVVIIVALLLSALIFTLHLPQRAAAVTGEAISVTPSSAPRGATISVTGTTYFNCLVNYLIFSANPERRWPVEVTPFGGSQWAFTGSMTVPGDAPISRYPLDLVEGNYPIEFHQEDEGGISCGGVLDGVFNVINRAPTASSFSLTTHVNTAVSENLVGYMSDPDGADGFTETYQVWAPPRHGIATVSGADLRYVPNTGFSGSDALEYRVCEDDGSEGGACSKPQTVSITVTASTVSVGVTVAPLSSCVSHPVGVVASVTQDGSPVPGVVVTFVMRMPGQRDMTVTGDPTDEAGHVAVSYSRPVAGNDSITARVSVPGGSPNPATSPPVVARWQSCPVIVMLAPAGTHTLAGNDFTATATVSYLGEPAAGAAVTLTATMPGQSPRTPSGTTDPNGLVSFVLHRDSPGVETLTAVAHFAGGQATAMTTHIWDPVIGPVVTITIKPPGVTSPVGSPFTATAQVTIGSTPLTGVVVRFRSVMTGQPIKTPQPGQLSTDPNGLASYTYTRNVGGPDTVIADVTVNGQQYEASLSHNWQIVPGLAIDLDPAGTASAVGDKFVATATVTDGKQHPLQGVTVAFSATMPGVPDQTGHPTTDQAGHASLSWSRKASGTDTITATVILDPARRGQATIIHIWRTTPTPTPSLTPGPDQALTADNPNPLAGATDAATGRGCPGRTQIALRLDTIAIANGTADQQGRFRIPFRAPTLPLGRHLLTATCGTTILTTPLDYVITHSSNSTNKAAVATTAAVLTFFVLLGLQILRPGLGSHPTP
jgi:hypothetical protein